MLIGMPHTTVRVSPRNRDRLRAIAAAEGLTMHTELPLQARYPDRASVAQTHLITTVPTDAMTGDTYDPVSAVELAQIRELLADQLDIP